MVGARKLLPACVSPFEDPAEEVVALGCAEASAEEVSVADGIGCVMETVDAFFAFATALPRAKDGA